jgi:hypothetical protein
VLRLDDGMNTTHSLEKKRPVGLDRVVVVVIVSQRKPLS